MGTGFAKKKKEARAMQQQFSMIQNQLSSMEITGTAGSGLVSIVLTGDGEMKSIKIKPECVDPEDIEGLEMLIKAAYSDAKTKLKDKTPPGLPGLFG